MNLHGGMRLIEIHLEHPLLRRANTAIRRVMPELDEVASALIINDAALVEEVAISFKPLVGLKASVAKLLKGFFRWRFHNDLIRFAIASVFILLSLSQTLNGFAPFVLGLNM